MSTGMFTVVLYRYFKEGSTVLFISPETGRSINNVESGSEENKSHMMTIVH
jgi:hypothetical protein